MGLRIMIVDDSPLIRSVLARCLHLSGLACQSIMEAGNGAEALERLSQQRAHLLFCDLHMPVMGGEELIKTLAADGRLATMKVLIISSDRSQERMQTLMALGVTDYLAKPFTPEAVREAILGLVTSEDQSSGLRSLAGATRQQGA